MLVTLRVFGVEQRFIDFNNFIQFGLCSFLKRKKNVSLFFTIVDSYILYLINKPDKIIIIIIIINI